MDIYSVGILANLRHDLSGGRKFGIYLEDEKGKKLTCKYDLELFKKIVDGKFMEA